MLRFCLPSCLFLGAVCLFLGAASAQQVDPRLSGPMIQALQAQVQLQQAMLRANEEDAEAQKKTLWQWLLDAKKEAAPKDR